MKAEKILLLDEFNKVIDPESIGKLFDFDGYRFIEGSTKRGAARYFVADIRFSETNPTFYQLDLQSFYTLITYWIRSQSNNHSAGILKGEIQTMTGEKVINY